MPKYSAFFNPFTVRVDFESPCKHASVVSERKAKAALWRMLSHLSKAELMDLIAGRAESDRIERFDDSEGKCAACGHSISLCICQRMEE